jgi:hypothetical protein
MQIVLSLIDQRIIDLPSGLIGRLFAVESIEQTNGVGSESAPLTFMPSASESLGRNSCNLYQRLADDY